MPIPDDLQAFEIKEALCHPSIGYKVRGSKPHAWYLSRDDGDVPIQIQKLSGPVRPSFVGQVLFYAGVTEKKFLEALAAATASSTPEPPPEELPPSASSPTAP
jgi:hypothetical protein